MKLPLHKSISRHGAGFRHGVCLLAGLFLGSYNAAALGDDPLTGSTGTTVARPKIGLVLAGGGAKGAAHVGVLKVLEELNVPIDCIAGTSMGALVGAGYASGIPANELEAFITGIDWKSVVGGLGQRDLQPIEQKREGVTYSNNFELGIQDGTLKAPGGLVSTIAIEDLLRGYVARARMQPNFDKLPIPFRAVATDMISGEMVVLSSGDLATAMRASMALPGAFAPVVTEKHILSDGGLVRNIPIDVARELCADVVIVVNLVEPDTDPSQLESAVQLLSRSMDVMIIANEELQLRTLTDQDIRIDVPMGDIGTGDFERIPETIPLGETAARSSADRLSELAIPATQYAQWRDKVTQEQNFGGRLAGVRYSGLERVNPEYLEQQSQINAGDPVEIEAISGEAQRISALREFESVEYRLEGESDEPTLVWLPKEKSWGPDYLKFDLGFYASLDGNPGFVISAQHTRTWLNHLGAEWRNTIQLGYETVLATRLYQPLGVAQTFFVEPVASVYRTEEDLYSDGERVATYQFRNVGAGLDFGANLTNAAQVRLGYLYNRRDIEVKTGSVLLPDDNYDDAGLVASAIYDSRDTPFNATRGMALALEYLYSDDSLGADRDWQRVEMGLGAAIPLRKDVVWLTFAGGTGLDDNLPADHYFSIGGPGSFPGYELGEIRSEEYWIASGSYLWETAELVSIRGQTLYTGLRLLAGETNNRLDMVDDGVFYGASLYLTGRTPIGPLAVGVGMTSTDSWTLWLNAGRPIGHGTILERGIFR